MSRRIYILGILLLFVAAVSSCRIKEMEPGQTSSTRPLGGKIAFELGTAKSVVPQTKGFAGSQQGTRSFVCVEGRDSLYLECTVADNNDPVFVPDAPVVKGRPVTTQNMNEFYIAANLTPELKYFPLTLVNESRKSENVYTLDYYWPQNSLDFYAANFYPPRENIIFGYEYETLTGTFSYTLPVPDKTHFNDAAAQPDYAFAITQGVSEVDINANHDGVLPLKFAHCLTSVTFKIGTQFMDPEGRRVKSVEIIGVPSSGTCTFYPDNNGDMVFAWDTEESALETYTQVIPTQDETSTNVANNQIINDGELTFMLIPYEFSDSEAKIRITFELHSDREEYKHTMVVEKNIYELFAASSSKEWYAGKKYIYTIVGEEIAQVEISDEFVSNEPMSVGNLEIVNKGNGPAYIRAYILGWWENETGDVVSPWLGSSEGTWQGAAWENALSKWKIGSDGFFYYTEPVDPDEKIEKLFESYTQNNSIVPVVGARLILNVVTQSVMHHKAEAVWPALSDLLNSVQVSAQ